MKNLSLKTITAALKGELHNPPLTPETQITGVVIDSRLLEAGNLFIATKGAKTDGHLYIPQVAKKGAAAVICEKAPEINIPYILVADAFKALKDIAVFYRSQLSLPVIGITGSVGKTSTKEFIASVLASRYQVLSTEGNYNNEIGLPLTILKIRGHHQAAVLEMGISDFGEMHSLSDMAKPNIAIITNIGDCHLENLGSREGVLKAKSEIFDFLADDGHIILNGDDILLNTIEAIKNKIPLRFGLNPENDIYADQIENFGLNGTAARINLRQTASSYPVRIPLPGEHMIMNALAAAAVGNQLGLTQEEIREGIKNIKSVSGRSNIIKLNKGTIIDDCYNANPVSMKAALILLKSTVTRKVAILGDMGELGANEKEFHASTGREAVINGPDVLIFIGSLAINMYEAAIKAAAGNKIKNNIFYFKDKTSFLEKAANILNPGDTVLIKASHSMAFETLVEEISKFFS